MTGTLSPAMNATAQGFSVTYSYFPPQPRCTETPPLAVLHSPASSAPEEYLFLRQGDYWVIRYQGQVAFLKTSRGLQCLSLLLHHPGREFHVSELLGLVLGKPAVSASPSQVRGLSQSTSDAGPILDGQAKAEYKLRLQNLREDLEDAERDGDAARAEQARTEIEILLQQLALAVGLGGRDRRTGSEAERARSAVTKRIKDAINKIGEAIPSLRRYLAAQVRTGYFCSYNLCQEHPVAWKILIFLTALCCDTDSYLVT